MFTNIYQVAISYLLCHWKGVGEVTTVSTTEGVTAIATTEVVTTRATTEGVTTRATTEGVTTRATTAGATTMATTEGIAHSFVMLSRHKKVHYFQLYLLSSVPFAFSGTAIYCSLN